ncbi:BREX protein BrxB domain-containing protein [Candidatus Bipolaricaulota bacterium]
MTELSTKLAILRERVLSHRNHEGALLIVYDPADELTFREDYAEIIQEAKARGVPVAEVDLRMLPFDVLARRDLLERAFLLDAKASRDAHQSLARMVQEGTKDRIAEVSHDHPDDIIFCHATAALFPWISYSSLLESIEATVPNTLILPFPGDESGSALHFLSAKDGYNYRATRI